MRIRSPTSSFDETPGKAIFSQQMLRQLQAHGQSVEMADGETLELNAICFLMSGSAKLWRILPSGAEHISAFAFAGGVMFGQAGKFPTRCTALEPCQVLLVPPHSLGGMERDDKLCAGDLLEVATQQIRSLQMHAAMLARMTACERVAAFLASLADGTFCDAKAPLRLYLPMSRADIGDHLGLTIETISRCMTRLKKDGLIACPARHEVLVLDLQGLVNYYDPG